MKKIAKPKLPAIFTDAKDLMSLCKDEFYLNGYRFQDALISLCEIAHLHLDGCLFINVDFEECAFDQVDLLDCRFENCDLSNCKFNDLHVNPPRRFIIAA